MRVTIPVNMSDVPCVFEQWAILADDGIEYVEDLKEGERKLKLFYGDDAELHKRTVTAGEWDRIIGRKVSA